MFRRIHCGLLAVVVVAALSVAACSRGAREKVRGATYAPEFRYLERQQIRTAMGRIAREVLEVESLMRAAAAPPTSMPLGVLKGGTLGREHLQKRIAASLERLQKAVESIDPSHLASNHPWMARGLKDLRRTANAAAEAARASPPSYFLAGTLVGRCRHCH
ncbi:MAG: hypothetical protein KC503_00240 [Myxococcales bacterium]|nr:hypothetical protein [Myxococcales bacterium]